MGNRLAGRTQHIPVGRQNEVDGVLNAGSTQHIERIQISRHVAIGRVNDRGAAVEDVVATEQQAVLHQHQAEVVGGVAGGVDDLEGMENHLHIVFLYQISR